MYNALLRLSRSAACLVLAGALLAGCARMPAASPRREEDTSAGSSAPLHSTSALEDGRLRLLYACNSSGGGTILRGGKALYQGSRSDSVQLVRDTLTGEADYYLVSHSTPGTEERTSTLYDANGSTVLTFPHAVNAALSGGLLILRDDADVWAFESGATGGIRVYDLATGAELPVPETALDCLVADEGGQRLIFNCYDLPEGLTYAYDDPDQPLHQYVLVTDRQGNVLLREDGCTASTFTIDSSGPLLADWVLLSWVTADWTADHEKLLDFSTGQTLSGSAISNLGNGVVSVKTPEGSYVLYDLNGPEPVEICQFDYAPHYYSPGCIVLFGWDGATDEAPEALVDLTSGEMLGVRCSDCSDEGHALAVLTADNTVRVYDTITGVLLTDVDAQLLPGAAHIFVSALSDCYVRLEFSDEDFNAIAHQIYGSEGLLWSSAGEARQYSRINFLTRTPEGPVLWARRDSGGLCDLLNARGEVLLQGLGNCYRLSNYPDGCFAARQGFDYGLMDSTGQWLYRESIFFSPADEDLGSFGY